MACHLPMAGMRSEMQSEKRDTPLTAQNASQDSMNCERASSRSSPFVMLQQPPQRLVADDSFHAEVVDRRSRRQCRVNRHVAETLMGPKPVIEVYPLDEDMSQMSLAEDDEMVEALGLGAAHPDFGVGIARRNRPELDAIGLQDGTELSAPPHKPSLSWVLAGGC